MHRTQPLRQRTRQLAIILAPLVPFMLACGGGDNQGTGDAPGGDSLVGGDSFDPDLDQGLIDLRPYDLLVPAAYDSSPLPLVVTLHGLGWTAASWATTSQLMPLAESTPFLLAVPQALTFYGTTVWNASCCGALPLSWDDVHYLRALIADARSRYAVDPKRIYFTGVSNGAFMAHVMGCLASDRVAAIATFAGTMWTDEVDDCVPAEPLAVMHTHGTADEVVAYDGGTFSFGLDSITSIGAPAVAAAWRAIDGCDAQSDVGSADLTWDTAGDDTTIWRWQTGCTNNMSVELWTIPGAPHEPSFNANYPQAVVDFLMAHPKP